MMVVIVEAMVAMVAMVVEEEMLTLLYIYVFTVVHNSKILDKLKLHQKHKTSWS